MTVTLQRLLQLARSGLATRFSRDDKGVALVEFAMIMPLMVLLYLGSVAVTMGVTTDRKLTLLARSLGDITAQDTNITSAEATDIFAAARAVMSPYKSDGTVLKMRMSSVKISADGKKACVRWSRSPNSGYARAANSDMTSDIPQDLRIANSYLVVPEVEYAYTPIVGAAVTKGTLTLKDILFMRPRQSDEVTTDSQVLTYCPA
jgi:Flp pilus assembly protein TadG